MANHPLTSFRTANNLTKAELAALLGVSRATVTRWENGERRPAGPALQGIASKTGIPARELRPDLAEMIEAAP